MQMLLGDPWGDAGEGTSPVTQGMHQITVLLSNLPFPLSRELQH